MAFAQRPLMASEDLPRLVERHRRSYASPSPDRGTLSKPATAPVARPPGAEWWYHLR